MGKKVKPPADATVLAPDVPTSPGATVLENTGPASPPGATVLEPDGAAPTGATVFDGSAPLAPPGATVLETEVETPAGATLPADHDEVRSAEDRVAAEWELGDVILDLYEVRHLHTGGAMGVVYRVRHRGWNMDLAVKSPRPDYFATEEQKANFVRECETWIGLGLHPHTVSCHYVRKLGGMPRVFAEYVEGGSLLDWIKTGKLYEGGQDAALERILDVAIQFAWGLGYAHEQDLIHRDIKPANVILTPDGVAKVTDFGLALARPVDEVELAHSEGGTVLIKGRGMTRAYCSPEQASGEEMSRKTDIWSWAVSLLEMFTGEVTWLGGQLAAAALQDYLDEGTGEEDLPRIPEAVAELLQGCFQQDPAERPGGMGEVAARLQEAYREVTGTRYPRQEPKAAELLADGLNNQAVSLLDLGRQEEAEERFARALQADSHHPEATYNRGLVQWRSGRLTDTALVARLEEVRTLHEREWHDEYYLGLIHLERGDNEAAAQVLGEAAQAAPGNDEVQRALDIAEAGPGRWKTCVHEFKGHQGHVTAVAIGGNGRWGISASADATLRLWEMSTGACVRVLEGHRKEVNSVSISGDSSLVLSGSGDKTLRLWELATGACTQVLEGHTEAVDFVHITQDAQWALSGSKNEKTLCLWELSTGRCVQTIAHPGAPLAFAASPDGQWAYTGRANWTLARWELATGEMWESFDHTGKVHAVAVTPNGRLALSGCGDGSLRLWDLATGQCIRDLEGSGSVNFVAVSPDGRCALSASVGATQFWLLHTGQCFTTHLGYSRADISPDGQQALLAYQDGSLDLLDLCQEYTRAAFAITAPQSAVEAGGAASVFEEAMGKARQALNQGLPGEAMAAAHEAHILPGHERHPVVLGMLHEVGLHGHRHKLEQAWCAKMLTGHSHAISCISISPDGLWALSAGHDETLRLWDLATGRSLRTLEGHTDTIHAAAVSPDSRWALSGSEDKTLRLWDLNTGECKWKADPFVFDAHGARAKHEQGAGGRVYSVAFSPDGCWAISGSEDKKIRLWNVETGKCTRVFEGHSQDVSSVAISPDGCRLLSAGKTGGLRLWELVTGECIRSFKSEGLVFSVTTSPDGRWGLSGGTSHDLKLWNLATGECERVFEGHTGWVNSVAISSDGHWILSGSSDKTLRLWELSTGNCVWKSDIHSGAINSVAISQDMRWMYSGSSDSALGQWELLWDYKFPESADWDEGALPYLQSFLTLHRPYGADGISRTGTPGWDDEEFERLLTDLQHRGYGWLRRSGVRRQLEKMAKTW